VTGTDAFPPGFERTVDFHGHLCLDIAMGYRVARAALTALGELGRDPAALVATVGNDTCAVDAVQSVTGCTFGKRNLVASLTGKPVYMWQHARTGEGVRAYVHYWDHFDADGNFRDTMRRYKDGKLGPAQAADFETRHGDLIRHILTAPEAELFRITPVSAPAPPKSGGFSARACSRCGEFAKEALLVDGLCAECASA